MDFAYSEYEKVLMMVWSGSPCVLCTFSSSLHCALEICTIKTYLSLSHTHTCRKKLTVMKVGEVFLCTNNKEVKKLIIEWILKHTGIT